MNVNPFDSAIVDSRERMNALLKRLDERSSTAPWLQALLEDFGQALEELHVAGEELCQTNDELLAAQQALEDERQRYQDLFDQAPDGYLVTDKDGAIRKANHAAGILLHVRQDLLPGRRLSAFLVQKEQRWLREVLFNLSAGLDDGRYNLTMQPKRGAGIPVMASVTVMRDGQGAVTGLRWLLRDMSERERMEAMLREANERLEERVAERTDELERANQNLRETDQAKDIFLAILSHELQTPLTSMLGWSEIALDEDNPTLLRHAMQVVHRNARRQKALVAELLDISRLVYQKLEIVPRPTELNEQARLVVESLLPEATHRAIVLTLESAAQALPILADADRLQQCIGNLINNALKFTPAGGQITITCGCAGHDALLSVRDTGRGIDPATLADLFTPFRQIDRDEAAGGLGLGLAIVHGLIALHGGDITADSPGLGEGSTFILRLPLMTTCVDEERKELTPIEN